jgi:very-short-patch-repair endonuclease
MSNTNSNSANSDLVSAGMNGAHQFGINETSTELQDLEARLRNQVAKWQSKLLDLGNRNPLINCSFNATRGVVELVTPETEVVWRKLASEGAAGSDVMRFPWRRELVPPPPEFLREEEEAEKEEASGKKKKEWNPPLEECRASRKLGARDLLTPLGDRALDRRLRTLDGHAHLSLSEQGVHCLYVAFGFLKWFESVDSDVEHFSPLMLVPVSLSRASADAPWELIEAEDDAIDNLCLRERFKQDFGLIYPALPDIDDLEEEGARTRFLNAVREAVSTNERWEVQDRCALGRFAFPKVAMWQDLGDHVESVLVNPLCRSIGGDETIPPQHSFGFKAPLPEAAKLDDEVAPGEIKTILDCDSSQLEAIIAARRGVSFVLDGPPGTGKSQTIANIIADALSEGRKVLFVSEKVSALEVVKRRLDDCGLGDFCLECHSSKANRKAVLDELKYCLDLPVEVYDDVSPRLNEAHQKRKLLNSYVRSIHQRRPPLGLSPYELYGHVSRSHRLGHAVKSRCELPSVREMDRTLFEDWLQLLERAQESETIIQGHERHPWRGCQLTTRTLTLSDELQNHLGNLATALSTAHQAIFPFVEQGLVANAPTLTTLNGILQSFRDVLNIPKVPAGWYHAPREVTGAILRRCDANHALTQHRSRIPEFVEDIENHFPGEITEFHPSSEAMLWLTRLEGELPQSLREQHGFLDQPIRILRKFAEAAEHLSTAATTAIGLIPVPIKAELPVYKFPAVVDLVRLVGSVVPLHPHWLIAENWPKLRLASQAALSQLEEATRIARRFEARLSFDQLTALSQSVDAAGQLATAWEAVRSVSPEGMVDELSDLQTQLQEGASLLQGLQSSLRTILNSWGIEQDVVVSLSLIRSLEAGISLILDHSVISGQWRDSAVRGKLRSACDAAISDLQEAAELREQLKERLSHRAFKSTASLLADQAPVYQSIWKRWFGGFKAYRQEVAELYQAGCPATALLLADLLKLRTWHRRSADVNELAQEVSVWLPSDFPVDDLAAWTSLRASLQTFEEFANVLPEVVSQLPLRPVPVDRSLLTATMSKINTLTEQFRDLLTGSSLEGQLDERNSISNQIQWLSQLASSIADCREAYTAAAACYSIPPKTLKTIVEDVQLAKQHAKLLETARKQFRPIVDLLPPDADATDAGMWKSLQRGILAAEKLGKLDPSLEKYQEVLCQPGRLNPSQMAESANNLDAAYRSFLQALQALVPHFRLLDEALSAEDLARKPLTVLLTVARSALPILHERHQTLATFLPALLPDADVPIDSLSAVRNTVEEIRHFLGEQNACLAILREWNVEPGFDLPAGGQVEAAWLLNQVKHGPIPPLTRAVSTSPQVRQDVQHALEVCDNALGDDFSHSLNFLQSVFWFEEETGHGLSIPNMPLELLSQYLQGLCSEMGSLDEWLKFSRWRRNMAEQGFAGVVEELLDARYSPQEAKSVIAARFFRLVFDQFAQEDRLIGEFDLEAHEQLRERFRRLDEWEVRAASSRIRQYQLGRDDRPRLGWFIEGTSELGVLQREIQKKRRQLPLRKLFAEVPSVLQRLKPCIMMSPLSVSTFLQSDELRFDLVIFDEASQVFPWDAMGAIYRGSQLIVAGDEKQLPPTNFFNRADIESADDEDSDIGDFESILSLCKSIGMPGRGLRWHYRSRREPLIAFSNRHFYSGDLVTFPSIRDATSDAVRLEFVPQGRWIERTNLPEAERVTDLVIRHLRTRPETSLGIIAFNQSQQSAIEDAIYERRRKYPEVETLFHTGLSEPLFIKNLENVQGDERDVIILSMGYGYNEAGKFLKNFGPLTKAGGERRLNVAVTRAREEVVLVASVKSSDLDLSGSTSLGAHLLKGYLEYAERGVDSLASTIDSITGEAESTFEQEVATALIARGLHPVLQVGCGGFRIDLALKHPQRPGEFCLGIECDGATYHSSKTARDRDRIRQSVLEQLGWNIIRIWSTDWIRNPERQLDRVLAAYERASTAHFARPVEIDLVEEDDLDDPVPQIEVAEGPTGPVFKAIKDVPEDHLRELFQTIVKRCGATDLEGLIQQTTRCLGFARTGKQIRQRLEMTLNDLLQVGHLRWVGERIASSGDELSAS